MADRSSSRTKPANVLVGFSVSRIHAIPAWFRCHADMGGAGHAGIVFPASQSENPFSRTSNLAR
jgi:hypothetical protein